MSVLDILATNTVICHYNAREAPQSFRGRMRVLADPPTPLML